MAARGVDWRNRRGREPLVLKGERTEVSTHDKRAAGGYRPAQQSIPAQIFTTAGWVSGAIHAPERHVWLDHVNSCGPWIKLTDAKLPGRDELVSFFALARTSAVLIQPTAPDPKRAVQPILGDKAVHHVDCLLDVGVISGSLELSPVIRVSDYLAHETDFMALRDCELQLFGRFGEATLQMQLPLAFVNCGRIIGVSEMDAG